MKARNDETTLAGVACQSVELCKNCSCNITISPLENQADNHRQRVAAAISRYLDRQVRR